MPSHHPKEILLKRFSTESDKYYRVKLFDEVGFKRKQCKKCGNNFWTLQERDFCPNPPCESYGFIGKKLIKKRSYIQTWRDIEKFFVKSGHESVPSYPVVCRWFPGLYFTIASIIAFQRSVGGKTVFEMPANPLIIPQSCLRFSDIPNVGVTGRHLTNFVMIGQHSIYDGKRGYWKDECIDLDFRLLTEVFKIDEDEINFVEDVWLGPNAFGYSLEYYVRGLELGNAVFTEFVGTPEKYSAMKEKIIDMGAGLERFAWFSQGTPTCYDAIFGGVMKKLKKNIDYDKKFFQEYAKISAGLNMDEVSDIKKAKEVVADKLDMSVEELIKITRPVEAVYAIADHSKTLLYAVTDGALPSNVGGGYNLRVVLRRALGFIDEFSFDIDLLDICRMHAKELKHFRDFSETLPELQKILDVEKKRFHETKKRSRKLVEMHIAKGKLDTKNLIMLYESHGVTPELVEEVAKEVGLDVLVPPEFYSKISEKHMQEKEEAREELDVEGIPPTRLLFYERPKERKFSATVLKIIGNNVILDKTLFYPEGGGQAGDKGFINGCEVYDTQKTGSVVIHKLDKINFREGDTVSGEIDWAVREQNMKHHTAIHIINAAAREVLGNHVWQSGSAKTAEKAHLDITHYEALDDGEIEKIENLANEIVKKKLRVNKKTLPRIVAEKEYGMRIYQGGVVPSKELRIIEITDGRRVYDAEACGGTHCDTTADVGRILVTSTERIQDGVVRITIVAGRRSEEYLKKKGRLLEEIENILGVKGAAVIAAAEKLFAEWKKTRKEGLKAAEKDVDSIAEEMQGKFVNNVLVEKTEGNIRKLQTISKKLSGDEKTVVLFGINEKIDVFVSSGRNAQTNAGEIVAEVCEKLGGKGGGSPYLGQGYGTRKEILDDVIAKLRRDLHG